MIKVLEVLLDTKDCNFAVYNQETKQRTNWIDLKEDTIAHEEYSGFPLGGCKTFFEYKEFQYEKSYGQWVYYTFPLETNLSIIFNMLTESYPELLV